jgi:RHS repeat-associated protein
MSDSFNSYQYDAEGNLIQTNTGSATFQNTYNALNQAVRLDYNSPTFSTYVESIFNAQGKFSANWGGGNFIGAEAYWGSTPVESYFASPTVTAHFLLRDALGSMRFETNNTGAVTVDRYTLPFGDGTTTVSGSRNTNDGFAGMGDGPAGNHAQFRDYSNVSGRWMQPDPYDGSYDAGNPQSLNRYSYVLNNPLGYVDPTGLFCEYGDDAGEGILEDVDYNSSRNECERTGGGWYDDGWGSTGGTAFCCDVGGGGGGIAGSGSAAGTGGGGGQSGGGGQTVAQSNPPTISPTACKAAAVAGGAAAGALVGDVVGGVLGGVGGAAAGATGGSVIPIAGTIGGGVAGGVAGAGAGSAAGSVIGGIFGAAAGGLVGNVACSAGTGGGSGSSNQSHCDAQLEADLNVCRAARSRACYAQAYVRHDVCSRGFPVPPLNF